MLFRSHGGTFRAARTDDRTRITHRDRTIGAGVTDARQPPGAPEPIGDVRPAQIFGRDEETSSLLERWTAEPVTVLTGPAGVGKTALVGATVARLTASSGKRDDSVLAGRIAVSDRPRGDGNMFVAGLLASWSATAGQPPDGDITSFLRRLRPRGRGEIFAVVDQVEALFRSPEHERDATDLLDQLAAAVRLLPGLHVLLSARDDVLPDLAAALRGLGRWETVRLDALGPRSAQAALDGMLGADRPLPVAAAGEVVRNLRTGRLVTVLGTSTEVVADTVEPAQLRAAAEALGRSLTGGERPEVVSAEQLYEVCDLDGALVRFCETAVHEVAKAHVQAEHELLGWLARTFVTDRGTRGTAHEGVTGVAGMPAVVGHALVDRHVLTAERRLGARWFRLPNDRLVAPLLEAAGRHAGGGTASARPSAEVAANRSLEAAEAALAAGELAVAAQRATEAARTSRGRNLRIQAAALSCLGHVAAEGGHDRQAESHYRTAAALFETMQDRAGSGRLLARLGGILLRRGRHAEAVAYLQGAQARLPGDMAVQVELARALRDAGQLWAATAVLGAALTVDPGTVDALVERGLIGIETGEFSSALQDLDNAIRLRPSVGQRSEIRSARRLAHARLGQPA